MVIQEKQQKVFLSFPDAAMEYFGFQPGQTTVGFMLELSKLTVVDRREIMVEFKKQGIIILP